MTAITGSRHIAEALAGYDVSHVFFVPAVLMQALAEMEGTGIRRIMAHTEKAAAYMADGYARASGKPGICMSQNIGGSNLAAGLRDARMAGTPVIAISGGPSASTRYRNYYQEIEDISQFDAVTKFNAAIDDVKRLPDLLRQAFREATAGAPGPVHLQVRGVLGEMAEEVVSLPVDVQKTFVKAPAFRPVPPQTQIDDAIALLTAAKRPIIVVGGGAIFSGAQPEVLQLAEKLGIPVATSLNAKGAISDTHPLSVGVVGMYSRDCANKAVARADVVFYIGSRTGSQVTHSWTVPSPDTAVIHLDIEGTEIGRNYPYTTPIIGDAKAGLNLMLQSLKARRRSTRTDWLKEIRGLSDDWRKREQHLLTSDNIPIRPERLCRAISNALPENGIVVSDTGHSGMWSSTMIDFTRLGQRYIRCAGSLGWAFPAALGVKCAQPDRPVVCFNGDGAFYYHLAELETAARCDINVIVVVNNNAAFNQEIHLVDDAYRNLPDDRAEELWRLRQVDFAAVAESFGCAGMKITDPRDLEPALAEAVTIKKPVVIDVTTDVTAMARHAWRPSAS